jgi:hypothetical protein
MRILIAIALGFALVIGVSQAASSGVTERGAQPSYELSSPAAEQTTEDAVEGTELEGESGYECKYSPYCRSASQCVAYCAGGAAVCSQGCCACAS